MKKYSSKSIDVTWKYDFQKKIRDKFSNKEWAEAVDGGVIMSILTGMNRGVSPVDKFKNFAKYKNPEKYPAKLKPSNKPNLNNEGVLYGAYKAKAGKELMSITLGVHESESKEIKVIAKANNEGTITKDGKQGIPARRFIPLKGENYKNAIVLEIRKLFAMILSKTINTKGE